LFALLRPSGLWVALVLLWAAPASAQRMQFPTPPAGGTVYTSQGTGAMLDSAFYQGSVGWDPYADPGAMQPPALNPYLGTTDPSPLSGNPLTNPYGSPPPAYGQPPGGPLPDPYYGTGQVPGVQPAQTRLVQEVSITNTWLNGSGSKKFGVDDLELHTSLAVPFFYQPAPIIVRPGFNFHFWDGPVTPDPTDPWSPDLPGQVYDAYLATGFKPQFTPWLSADLGVSVGVYSDFQYVSDKSIRVLGRGMGVLTMSPQWQVHAGVIYVNRLDIKILPAGGVVWTPNADARFELLFPRPKLAQRITTYGNNDIWGYIAGEWGGGAWTIERRALGRDRVEYSDLRLILGVEWLGMSRITGNFEVGYVFNRKIIYVSGTPDFEPSDTVMLRASLGF
jgi:hypothetical protein